MQVCNGGPRLHLPFVSAYTVVVEQAELGWTKPVSLEGLQLQENSPAESNVLFSVQRVSTSKSLWDIAGGQDFDLVIERPLLNGAEGPSGNLLIADVIQACLLSLSVYLKQCLKIAKNHHKRANWNWHVCRNGRQVLAVYPCQQRCQKARSLQWVMAKVALRPAKAQPDAKSPISCIFLQKHA